MTPMGDDTRDRGEQAHADVEHASRQARRAQRALKLVEVRQREERAVALRLAGGSFEQIARAVGYAHRRAAQAAVDRALARGVKPAAELLRAEMIARIDALLTRLWPHAMQQPVRDANTGEIVKDVNWKRQIDAVVLVNQLEERRARLEGLDRPATVDFDQVARDRARALGITDEREVEEIVAEAERMRVTYRRGRLRALR